MDEVGDALSPADALTPTDAAVAGDGDGQGAGPSLGCAADQDCAALRGPCEAAYCILGTCVYQLLADDTTCTSGGTCPTSGVCKGGTCVLSGGEPCEDGNPCTKDLCTAQGCLYETYLDGSPCPAPLACQSGACTDGKCQSATLPGFCAIDGACAAEATVRPGWPCQRCNSAVNAAGWTLVSDVPCDDGNACSQGDSCDAAGACSGVAVACPDSGPCQQPVCSPATGCGAAPVAGNCSDGNPCSVGDQCAGGLCEAGKPLDCSDGNPCTADSCSPGFGCLHQNLTAPAAPPCLADSDPCTQDVCVNGTCTGVAVLVCKIGGTCVGAGATADGKPCLVCDPVANPMGWTAKSAISCDDGDACTVLDTCEGGACEGYVPSCDDANPCTADSCNSKLGCVALPQVATCSDGDLCTLDDACKDGKCVGVALGKAACDDGNPCTSDQCLAALGCVNQPNSLPCNDGDPCTKGDFCSAAQCIAGQIACPCGSDADCDDGNPCSKDQCVTSGCQHTALSGAPCQDGDACTAPDACSEGKCAGAAVSCDDGNVCTADFCGPLSGCVNKPTAALPCDDGSACTLQDLCVQGACQGVSKLCDDGNPCTVDECLPATGGCGHDALGNGSACPADGIACTLDQCIDGSCDHSAIQATHCLISGICISAGTLQPIDSCLGCLPQVNQKAWSARTGLPCEDGNACTTADLCVADGLCKGAAISCADGEACTLDACNPQGGSSPCFWTPMPGPCNDGNACTTGDTCSLGKCAGVSVSCDDGDPCTFDTCSAGGGCQHSAAADGSPCADDGLVCTADQCAGGQCGHPPLPQWCLIQGVCRSSGQASPFEPCYSCQPNVSVQNWTAATGTGCNDGNLCTQNELCVSGVCKGGTAACDDGNPCTIDSCTATSGCSHSDAGAIACDDGNACTSNDACTAGTCSGVPVTCAVDAEATALCKVAACNPLSGCVALASCPALHACVGGQCLTSVGGAVGPVTVPVQIAGGGVLRAPSIAWQETAADWMGPVPRLWLAAHVEPCGAADGRLAVLRMTPGAGAADALTLPVAAGVCQSMPQWLDHPTSLGHVALAWMETQAGTCASGRAVLGVAGSSALTAGAATPCMPVGDARPALWLTALGATDVNKPSGLQGFISRATPNQWWASYGSYATDWGVVQAVMPLAGEPPSPYTVQWGRVSTVSLPPGAATLFPTTFSPKMNQAFEAFSTVQFAPLGVSGAPGEPQVLASGLDVLATQLRYLAVEASWDGDSQRLGMLVSGTLVQNGTLRGFLAFARAATGLPAATPSLWQLTDVKSTAAPIIHAFRLAEVPGSADFLLAWVMPASSELWLARIKPLNDKKYVVVSSTVVASDVQPPSSETFVGASGGLSELLIAPKAQRYSIAYETPAGVRLLTAPLPK